MIRPVASRKKVTGSVSTTLGGVPRVWAGPGPPTPHWTAAYGGTLTSTERPGCSSGQDRGQGTRGAGQRGPGEIQPRLVRQGAAQVVTVHNELDDPGVQQVLRGDRAARPEHHIRQRPGGEPLGALPDDLGEQSSGLRPG